MINHPDPYFYLSWAFQALQVTKNTGKEWRVIVKRETKHLLKYLELEFLILLCL